MANAVEAALSGVSTPWSAVAIQPPAARWYCVETHPGREREAQRELNNQDFTTYLPLFGQRVVCGGKASVKVRVLFPSYLFVAFDRLRDQWRPIVSTRGVKRLFCTSPEAPTSLPVGTVETMLATANAQSWVSEETLAALQAGTITALAAADRPKAKPAPVQPLAPATPVTITSGPLAGQVAKVEWGDARRVCLLLSWMGQRVTMSRASVVVA